MRALNPPIEQSAIAPNGHRVAHLTSVHGALDGRIFYRESRSLARAGYDVVIIAPGGADRVVDGVRIRAVPAPRNRIERLLVTGLVVLRAALRERCDIYHFHDPELMAHGLALRALGKRVIYDAHEDTPKDLAQKQYIPRFLRRPAALFAKHASRICSRVFNATIAAVPSIADDMRGRRVVVHNYPVLNDLLGVAVRPWSLRTRDAIYVGSISQSRGLREMIAAMSSPAMPPGARLTLAGRFEDAGLERRAQFDPGWARVDFVGWREATQLWHLVADAKVGIVTLYPLPTFLESMPTKLFEYMALGLPVVASNFPLWRPIVESTGCGLLVDPMDSAAIGEAVSFLLNHPREAEAMGRNGREAVRTRYAWETEAAKLLALYADLNARP